MKRYLLLAVFAAAPLAFLTGCPKTVPVPEAGVIDAAAVDTSDAGVAVDDGGIEAAAPLTTVVVPHPTVHVASGGPFQGTYHCFNNMTTSQNGNTVVAHTNANATMTCTISGDICDGHVVTVTNGKSETRHATLKKNAAGDLTYKGDGEPQPTFCKKQ